MLKDIAKDKKYIQEIIENNGLNPDFKFGRRVSMLREAYNGSNKTLITKEEKRLAEELRIIRPEAESAIAETLRICQVLNDNGIDLSEVQLSKKRNGEQLYFLLKEITQEGINIRKIIEKNGLDPEFTFGKRVNSLRLAYNQKGSYAITEEEKRLAEKLGIIQEYESAVSETLRICQVLKMNGVDLSEITVSKETDNGRHYFLLGEIVQEGIDIGKIIEENGLDINFKFGRRISKLRGAYKGTEKSTITEAEKRMIEQLGLIKLGTVEETLKICEILKDNGVDLSKIQCSKKHPNGQYYFLLRELIIDGGDIKKIIEENGLNPEFEYGQKIKGLKKAYRGTGNYSITDEEKKRIEILGIIKETPVSETLRICQVLKKNGVELRHIQVSKRINGKKRGLLLSELNQDGIDIQRLIEENGLDPKFRFGDRINGLRCAYRGTGKLTITEEEKQEVIELGLIVEKELRKKIKEAVIEQKNKGELGQNQQIEADIFEETIRQAEQTLESEVPAI